MFKTALRRFILFGIVVSFMLSVVPRSSASEMVQRSGFPVQPGAGRIKFGSVTLADLNADGKLEILAGSETGILYVLNQNGSVRWSYDVGAAINAAASRVPGLINSTRSISIRSAPVAADITGDSRPEVIVSAGDIMGDATTATHGGVVALSPDGVLLSGWPQLTKDFGVGPVGYTEGVVSSPSVGDITGDGVSEIIYGGFDQYIYAKEPDGSDLPGWPKFALDTIWASPALADLNGDGISDVIIGVDSHNYSGNEGVTVDGGYLYAITGDGTMLWSKNQDEIFESSSAVSDLDGDGLPEIATGSGTYYGDLGHKNAQGGRVGQYFTVWNNDGSILWRVDMPERVIGSPAIGDITGDSGLEVVVGCLDGKIYAFDGKTGAIRWSTLGRDIFNNKYIPIPKLYSPVLGDFDGDGRDDVFAGLGWDVIVMRGTDGVLLTATSNIDRTKPSFYGAYTIDGTPALGDLDGNGKLDLVSASGMTTQNRAQINSWELSNSTTQSSWPMFRRDATHHASFSVPKIHALSNATLLVGAGQARTMSLAVRSSDGQAITWSVKQKTDPNNIVQVTQASGTASIPLQLTVNPGALAPGTYTATLTISATGMPDTTITITALVVSQVYQANLPLVAR